MMESEVGKPSASDDVWLHSVAASPFFSFVRHAAVRCATRAGFLGCSLPGVMLCFVALQDDRGGGYRSDRDFLSSCGLSRFDERGWCAQ